MVNMEVLLCGLPEDIRRCAYAGYFQEAEKRIDRKLRDDIPEILRDRLLLEKRFIQLLPAEYPYSREEAFNRLREAVPDITEAEFDALDLSNRIEFIYMNGEKRYLSSFRETLLKTESTLRKRAGLPPEAQDGFTAEMLADLMRTGSVAAGIRLRATLRINDEAFHSGAHVRVHLPVPRICAQQSEIAIHSKDISSIDAPDALQRTAFFERGMSDNEPFCLEYSYINTIRYISLYTMDEVRGEPVYPAARPVKEDDLAELAPHIVFSAYLNEIAHVIVDGARTPLEKARRIYDYITTHISYMFMRPYLLIENQAEYCAMNAHGDCGIMAILFITLCRIAGIPARWQSGLAVDRTSAGCHDWAQFYLEPLGWVFCDPSYGVAAARRGDEAMRRFYFGNLDPLRMVSNGEYQAKFHPAKYADRFDPYDNQSGEVEVDGRGLTEREFTTTYKTVELNLNKLI